MEFKKSLCVLLCAVAVAAVGCGTQTPSNNSVPVMSEEAAATEPTGEVVRIEYGESASFGNMTVTVNAVEDPSIVMNSGKKAMFFNVTIENHTEETVTTNYLNNFAISVDGTYYDAVDCFTMPVMQKLYDFYGMEPFRAEIPAGESVTGYLAAEVNPEFTDMELHYTPKTTDRSSRISVSLTQDNVKAAVRP